MNSNMFENVESKFWDASKEEITSRAVKAALEIDEKLTEYMADGRLIFEFLLTGIRFGVVGDGVINDKEKELIKKVLEEVYNNQMPEELYECIGTTISDADYALANTLAEPGNPVAMPFLEYVLCFAYIDGVLEDEVAESLDNIFGMCLLSEFYESDMEEVPKPTTTIKRTGLSARIAKYLDECEEFRSLKDIKEEIPDVSEEEIRETLAKLAKEDIVICMEVIGEKRYAINK